LTLQEKYLGRFEELEADIAKHNFRTRQHDTRMRIENGDWQKWATSAQNLIEATFGVKSAQARNFFDRYQKCEGLEPEVRSLYAIFRSASEDFRGGFAGNIDLRISGEVFGDFVALAKQSLSEGHKDVAAVLACAALEDALKRFAAANGLEPDQKTMTDVINSLKGAGLVSGAQKSLLDVMPRIRNAALHAEWDKLSEPDVNSVIGFVEQFLLTKFE
jgi:hypothetical protein